jgi:RNA polymerase sigma-70 factor (ECF subfamily)
LANKNLNKFELLFKELFKPLSSFALKYVCDIDDAKGIVHEVFVAFWEKFDNLSSDTNYRSYLYTAVRNRCLNYIRDSKKHVGLENVTALEPVESNTAMEASELECEIELSIQSLPEKCRIVFEMNRNEGLKYAQIAEKLGISVKTVEAQISKALSILRDHLSEFMTFLFFLLWK